MEQFSAQEVDESTFDAEQSPYPRPLTRKFDASFAMTREAVIQVLLARAAVILSTIFGALLVQHSRTPPTDSTEMWLYGTGCGVCAVAAYVIGIHSLYSELEPKNRIEVADSAQANVMASTKIAPLKTFIIHSGIGSRQISPFIVKNSMGISLGLYQQLTDAQLYALRCWVRKTPELPLLGYGAAGVIYSLFNSPSFGEIVRHSTFPLFFVILTYSLAATIYNRKMQEKQLRAVGLWEPLQEALHIQTELSTRLPWYIRPIWDLRFGFKQRRDLEPISSGRLPDSPYPRRDHSS